MIHFIWKPTANSEYKKANPMPRVRKPVSVHKIHKTTLWYFSAVQGAWTAEKYQNNVSFVFWSLTGFLALGFELFFVYSRLLVNSLLKRIQMPFTLFCFSIEKCGFPQVSFAFSFENYVFLVFLFVHQLKNMCSLCFYLFFYWKRVFS